VKPEPPAWALDAGLPNPTVDEEFAAYCVRLGIDPVPLIDGLTEQTLCIANSRLANHLQREMPRVWQAHINERVAEHVTPQRRRELQRWAHSNMPRDI
jgi:hypothetical protein